MKTYRGCGLLPWLLMAMSLLLARPIRVLAADSAPRQEAISLNAGETSVIDNLNPESKPAIKVIDNPHALVVHNEDPTKLVLLGAEKGKWAITVKLSDGDNVVYNVDVHAIRDAANPLKPADPSAADDSTVASASPAPADSGADSHGPVIKSATTESEAIPAPAAPAPAAEMHSENANAIGASADNSAAASGAHGSSVIPSQTASAGIHAGKYTTDPGLVASGEAYSTEGVAFSGGTHYLPADGIDMPTGTSQIIDFPRRMHRVSIADTEIADVQVVNPYQLNLIGHKPGFTTLTVWTGQGHYEERQVRVDPNGKQQVLLNTVVAELNRGKIENQGINLTAALPNYNVSLIGFPGAVATPYSGQTNLGTSNQQNGQSTSAGQTLLPGGQLLPLLLSQNMTYGLAAQNSNVLTQTFFQFLENHNLGKILAQPHLLANSGEKAQFLDGGEIPIIVAQALNTSVVFKDFGTKVEFLPTVVGVNDIELLVKPEVSEPDFAHGVNLFGFQVPAFVTRRAETLVRLKDNQTLIIAGLILHEKKEQIDKVPYLGDIPYVRGLFRHTSWNDSESDLVMSVTPQIVRPLPTGGQVYLPTSHPQLTGEDISTRRLDAPDIGRPRF
jgi:pilus assembly protein CpaC